MVLKRFLILMLCLIIMILLYAYEVGPGEYELPDGWTFDGEKKPSVINPNFRGNENLSEIIRNAETNDSIVLDIRSDPRNQLHRIVFDAWSERPDLAITLLYRQNHKTYLLSIPAGSDLSRIPGKNHSVMISSIAESLQIEPLQVSDDNLQDAIKAIKSSASSETSIETRTNNLDWICPNCNAENWGNFCSVCGAKNVDTRIWICPNCYAESSDNYCSTCGEKKPDYLY